MKKVAFILFFVSTVSFAQTITSKKEDVNVDQYELIKKVNQFYPDIAISKQVTNYYADGKIIDSQQEFDLTKTKFLTYKLGIEPGNKKMLFEYSTKEDGKSYGDITLFNGDVVKTVFSEGKNQIEFYVNGKAVYQKK